MKNFGMKLMIAAAALVAVAGSASAQVLKADVPFAFRVGNTLMEPGTYKVDLKGPAGTLWITDRSGKDQAVALPTARLDGATWGDAKLVFACGTGGCSLRQAWSGDPSYAYAFRISDRSETYLRVIRLRLEQSH